MSNTGHHTLADALRSRTDDALITLLRIRPDLAIPLPGDFGALAARAHAPTSISRVLSTFNEFTMRIADSLRLFERHTATREGLAELLSGYQLSDETAAAAVNELIDAAMVWEIGDGQLRIVGAIDEVMGPYPCGLGRPLQEISRYRNQAEVLAFITDMPPAAAAVAQRLAAGPPIGIYDPRTPSEAMQWLLDRGVVIEIGAADGEATVELPREIGLALRGDKPLGELRPQEPPIGPASASATQIEQAGTAAAAELLRHLEALLTEAERSPITTLRAGGIGITEQRRLAQALDITPHHVVTLLEIAAEAGLLGQEEHWLPTAEFDSWRALEPGLAWAEVAASWLRLPSLPSLVNTPDQRGRRIAPLSAEISRPKAPNIRTALLEPLTKAAGSLDQVVSRFQWRHPRWTASIGTATLREILHEAELVGLVARGGIPGFAVALVLAPESGPAMQRAAEEIAALLPAPIDYFLVQPDLTVVAPGPLRAELASTLALAADVESAGGATVYRVSTATVKRALQAGQTSADLHALFTKHSQTPVPQNLTYLIDDVARHHDTIRIGAAGSYLRSDDPARLAELLADKRLAALQLRTLAPTIAISPLPPHLLNDFLAEAGHTIATEDASGSLLKAVSAGKRAARTRRPLGGLRIDGPAALGPTELLDAVARLRRRDETAQLDIRSPEPPEQDMESVLAILQQAVRDKAQAVVGYVSPHGAVALRTVQPVSVGGGYLRAEDPRTDSALTFALHRISSVTLSP